MRNKITVLLVISILLICSITVMADETPTFGGFYNIGTATGVQITPYAENTVASVVDQDVDKDSVSDKWYKGSDRIEVSCNVESDEGYYGVILVEGSNLPTKDNAIFYVDQVSPENGVVSFNVYPILPETTSELSLYISSSVDSFELIKIPLGYAVGVEEVLPSYTLGDVDNDGVYGVKDALIVLQIGVDKYPATEAEFAAADVDGDGVCGVKDALLILQYGTGKISSFR